MDHWEMLKFEDGWKVSDEQLLASSYTLVLATERSILRHCNFSKYLTAFTAACCSTLVSHCTYCSVLSDISATLHLLQLAIQH
jgi:hypothetical protein